MSTIAESQPSSPNVENGKSETQIAANDNNAAFSNDSSDEDNLYEYNAEDEADDQDLEIKSRSISWPLSKASLFDYKVVSEEEEQEEPLDSEHYYYFPGIKYDFSELRDHGLKEEERQEILGTLKEMFSESKVLLIKNKFLHKQYIKVIRNSSSFSSALDDFDESLIFEDSRYFSRLENYEQMRNESDEKRASLTLALKNLEDNYMLAELYFNDVFENLIARELAVAKKIRPRKMSKEVWLQEVDQMIENQRNRIADVAKIRLAYVRLHYNLEKLQSRLRELDNLGPGFSMIDYEYLLKKKELYTEKRDEQVETIKKLKEKNLACAAILKHVGEESDMYVEMIKGESDILNTLIIENKFEHSKVVELMKERALTFKIIMKLKDEMELLDHPCLLKKMELVFQEIANLKKQSEVIESKMQEDKRKLQKRL